MIKSKWNACAKMYDQSVPVTIDQLLSTRPFKLSYVYVKRDTNGRTFKFGKHREVLFLLSPFPECGIRQRGEDRDGNKTLLWH